MLDYKEFIDDQYESAIELWRHIVEIESGSANVEGVANLAAHLDTYFNAMGLKTKKYTFPSAGPSLMAETKERELKPVILMAHMDTVHKNGAFGGNNFVEKDGKLFGPGVYDCKGGIVTAVLVIKALLALGYKKRQIKLLLTGDEEVAHSLSQSESLVLYRENVPGAACAFNCESGLANGDVVLQRKGGAMLQIKVHGIASHAGLRPKEGANAILAAAEMITKIEALTDYPDGVYYNCGKITGGGAVNIIPDYAEIGLALRFNTNAEFADAVAKLEKICAEQNDKRITAGLTHQAVFKAMERTEKTDAFFAIFQEECAKLGFDKPQGLYVGGCSDAAYTTMEGVPTICGCGVRGGDNHTLKEWCIESSVLESAKKIVATILALPDNF